MKKNGQRPPDIGDGLQRQERVHEATNRILGHPPGAELDNGKRNEQFHKVEDAADTIPSTIGVPDKVVDE